MSAGIRLLLSASGNKFSHVPGIFPYSFFRLLRTYAQSTPIYTRNISTMTPKKDLLLLFDVDGTLTEPRQKITKDMKQFLQNEVLTRATVGLVGGSDISKIADQIGDAVLSTYDYVFSENGLVAYHNGKLLSKQSIQSHLGEDKLQQFLNFSLRYIADLNIPVKRGTFIEFRTGLVNLCPVGRNCSQQERDEFEAYDKVHNIRKKFVEDLQKEFASTDLQFSIGGQISIDVFPIGWDKTYCLQYVSKQNFNTIHFFGDKTDAGGNDHEIYSHSSIQGHKVKGPNDTKEQVSKVLGIIS